MENLLKKDLLKLKEKYEKELIKVEKDIEDFKVGLDVPLEEKRERLDEMIDGRLSAKNLTKNYEKKNELLQAINNLNILFYNNN